MNSPEINEFIWKHRQLFWYMPEDRKDHISLDVLVEFILNFGDMSAIKELIEILGIKRVAGHFFHSINLSERRKGNYNELTLNYFTLLFNRYAHSDINRQAG